MNASNQQSIPLDALSIADSPLAQYLADAGLTDEVEATLPNQHDNVFETAPPEGSTDTIPAGAGGRQSSRPGSGWALTMAGGGMAAVALVGWIAWRRGGTDRSWVLAKSTVSALVAIPCTLASLWHVRHIRARTLRSDQANPSLDATWANLERALLARYRYLREVDLVSRGYKLQSHALPSAWASDSFRKRDQRRILVSCLSTTVQSCAATLATLPTPPDLDALRTAIDTLVANASSEYSLAAIKDLLFAARELAQVVLDDAELVATAALATFVHELELVAAKLVRSDPLSVTPAPDDAPVQDAPRSSPIATHLATLHAHLHTMQVKTHLALTEASDHDPIALSAYLTAMPDDIEYLNALLGHLRALAAGTGHTRPEPLAEDDDIEDATIPQAPSRWIVADDDDADQVGTRLDAEAWTGEVDVLDHGEATLRPRSTLAREERIALRREQLAQQAAARVAANASLQFVGELKNVLDQRRGNS